MEYTLFKHISTHGSISNETEIDSLVLHLNINLQRISKELLHAFATLWEFSTTGNMGQTFISFSSHFSTDGIPLNGQSPRHPCQSQVGDQMCRGTAARAAVPRCFQFSFHIFFGVFCSILLRFEFSFNSYFLGIGEWNACASQSVAGSDSWGRCCGCQTSPAPLPTLTLLDGDGDPWQSVNGIPELFYWQDFGWAEDSTQIKL